MIIYNHTDGRSQGVGGTKHSTASLDGIETLEDNSNNGTRSHVLDQTREERLVGKISIVYQDASISCDNQSRSGKLLTLLEVFFGGLDNFKSEDLISALFEPSNDLSDKSALDTVGLQRPQCQSQLRRNINQGRVRLDKRLAEYLDHNVGSLSGRHAGCCWREEFQVVSFANQM